MNRIKNSSRSRAPVDSEWSSIEPVDSVFLLQNSTIDEPGVDAY